MYYDFQTYGPWIKNMKYFCQSGQVFGVKSTVSRECTTFGTQNSNMQNQPVEILKKKFHFAKF